MSIGIKDKDIITKSIKLMSRGVTPSNLLEERDWGNYLNVFSSATGDNYFINPEPQSSPATDPRYGRFMQSREGGMGSMYKTLNQDNATTVTFVPGVVQFTGLLSFITNMFSPAAAIIANKGRAPSTTFYIGQAMGAVAFWPMQLLSIGLQFLAFLMESPRNDFWTVKPAMGAFTMASTGVLNDMLVRLGYIDPILPTKRQQQTDPINGITEQSNLAKEKAIADLRTLAPDVINEDGTIDLLRLVMKGTRKHRSMLRQLAKLDDMVDITTPDEKLARAQELIEQMDFDSMVINGENSQAYVVKEFSSVGLYRGDDESTNPEMDSAFTNKSAYQNVNNAAYGLSAVQTQAGGTPSPAGTASGPVNMGNIQPVGTIVQNPNEPFTRSELNVGIDQAGSYGYEDNPDDRSWAGDVYDLLKTAAYGGLDALTFRVEGGIGPVTDSFSNQTAKSPLADKFNSVVKSVNDFKFDVAGGNTGFGLIDGIVEGVKNLGIGALSGTVIGNIPLALAGNSRVKVADHWDGSTTNLHSETYTITSRCLYAHPYEEIMKVWVPFSLILPLVAGFSTGGASYTTPFMVKCFAKGRSTIRTGMITKVDFTFGEGGAGWSRARRPLNITMRIEVTDLDDIVTIPIDRSVSLLRLSNPADVASSLFSNDTGYSNWLNRLSGLDYLDSVLKYETINRRLTGLALDISQTLKPENMAAKLSDSIVGDLGRIFTKPIAR